MSTNPYQTPEGQLTTDDQAVGEIKFFSPSSRINRLRYWAHSMVITFVLIGVFTIIALLASVTSLYVAIGLGVIAYIAAIVFSFILMIQRLHDLNKSGWMSLLCIVPLANIYLIVLLIFFKGTEGRNNYGLPTPPNKTWHWVMAFSLPVLVVVLGILSAIALPAYQSYVNRAAGLDSAYDSSDSDTYPDEYIEEGAVDDTLFNDEALEDGISYETPEEEIIEDSVIEESVIEDSTAESSMPVELDTPE